MTDGNSTQKKCTCCKQVLSVGEFNKNKSKRDGLATDCRQCMSAYLKRYVAQNIEAHRARGMASYRAKPQEYKDRARRWEKNNPELKRAMRAKYRAADPEKANATSRADWIKHREKRLNTKAVYRKANPAKGAAYCRNRQARKAQAMPRWADVAAIELIYRQARALSEATGEKYHVDHIVPLKGKNVSGLHVEYNLMPIPALENHRKSNKLLSA